MRTEKFLCWVIYGRSGLFLVTTDETKTGLQGKVTQFKIKKYWTGSSWSNTPVEA